MKPVWDDHAWADYQWWHTHDPSMVSRINTLLRDIAQHGHTGLGRPEPLRQGFHGYWVRRITLEHRLVYKVVGNEIRIASCRYRYS